MDGRDMLVAADGKALTDSQRDQLKAYAQVIKTNWEKVIAEAVFKYAGSTYKDMMKIEAILESGGDVAKEWRNSSTMRFCSSASSCWQRYGCNIC